MALHDTDKNNQDRSKPMPNVHGKIIPEAVKANSTISTSYAITGPSSIYDERVQLLNNGIMVYDGSNQRIVIGILPDGTYGLEISKEGYNVTDAYPV